MKNVITVNLHDEQVRKAQEILRELRRQQGEDVNRSEVFRMAIDALHIAICHPPQAQPTTEQVAA